MAGTGHFYITAHGEYTTGWVGEFAQIGFRWMVRSGGSQPGPVIDLPDLGRPTQMFADASNSDFNITRTFNQDVPFGPMDWDVVADDLASDMRDFLVAVKAYQSQMFRWTHIKIAPIERGTGKYLAPASTYSLKAPIVGGVLNSTPPEVAIACSLRAAVVGKRGRGRAYIPSIGATAVDQNGKVTSAASTLYATSLQTFARAAANLPGLDLYDTGLIVCSGNALTAVLPTEVRVGAHLDAQRRRQHQVKETYTTLPI